LAERFTIFENSSGLIAVDCKQISINGSGGASM
jgi:hypothetical protein